MAKTTTTNSTTKNGSPSTSDDDGFTDLAKSTKRKGPGKGGASLQERRSRQRAVGEVPPEAAIDPVKWAGDHLKTLAPDAAKEVEYALKFGNDQMRYLASRDVLAINGHTTKPKETGAIPVSMTFNVGNLPTTPTGVPILPFSNAAKRLAAPQTPVTIDVTPTPAKDS